MREPSTDDIPFRIDAGPLLGDNPAVDLDASLGDQLLARPSAGYARLRERLLQAPGLPVGSSVISLLHVVQE